jgi:hypothetical protein
MTAPVKIKRRRWVYGIAVVALLGAGSLLFVALDPLNSAERRLVGVWKERTTRRNHDVLAFSPDRRYFVNNDFTGTWRAVDGQLQVKQASMSDVPLPLMIRLYMVARRPFANAPPTPVATAAITRNGPNEITLRPEPCTDETTFDRVPGAQMPEIPRFDEDGAEADDSDS